MASRSRYDATAGAVLTATNLDTMPGGWVGYVTSTGATGSITGSATDVSGMSQAWTAEANRVYLVTAMTEITSSVAADTFVVAVTNVGNTQQHRATGTIAVAATNQSVYMSFIWTGSGAQTFKIRANRAAGTGNITCGGSAGQPSQLIIQDIGSV